MRKIAYGLLLLTILNGCAVVAVTDAVVSVGATAVKAGVAVVGTAVGVTTTMAKKALGSDDEKKDR